jgi:hypothetical protein
VTYNSVHETDSFLTRFVTEFTRPRHWISILSQLNAIHITSVDPEIGIRRVATNKDKDKLQKIGLYLNMYLEKWKKKQ